MPVAQINAKCAADVPCDLFQQDAGLLHGADAFPSAYCGRTVPDLRDLAASSSPLKHAASTTEKEEGGGGGQLDGDATTSMLRSTSCTVLTWTDDTALPSLRGHGILYCRAKDIAVALAPQGLRLF
ncbi:unnamed protein product [Lampetra fluviatilis]